MSISTRVLVAILAICYAHKFIAIGFTSCNPDATPGMYLHIPFCRRQCYYCDFPIKVVGEKNLQLALQEYSKVITKEMTMFYDIVASNKPLVVNSIYFGGGTPSLLHDEELCAIMKTVHAIAEVQPQSEVSFEADPGTFDTERLSRWHDFGINRLSVGIQSFDSKDLKHAGRANTLEESFIALDAIQQSPIHSLNIDLISSLPHCAVETWGRTLDTAIQVHPQHISVYDLQIEEKTAFGRWYTPGQFPLPDEAQSREMFEVAVGRLTSAGYSHYEVSNYALPGHQSRHNMKYWTCAPIAAFGMGAASYLNGHRFTRPSRLSDYYNWVENMAKDPELYAATVTGLSLNALKNVDITTSTKKPDILEFVMLALRTQQGLCLEQIDRMFGPLISKKVVNVVGKYVLEVETDGRRVRLKDPEGFIISNTIISDIFAALEIQ